MITLDSPIDIMAVTPFETAEYSDLPYVHDLFLDLSPQRSILA